MPQPREEITVRESLRYPGVEVDTRLLNKNDDPEWLVKRVHPLVGKTIKSITIEMFDGRPLVALIFNDGPVVAACVMCDEEGNGPGWLDIIQR